MSISNFCLFSDELKREVNFDLADQNYYCDHFLNENFLSQNTHISASDSINSLEYQAKKYLDDQLSDPTILQKAKLFSDFQEIHVNNINYNVDLLASIFDEFQNQVCISGCLSRILYISSFADKNKLCEEYSNVFNELADFIVLSDDPVANFNQTICDFESYRKKLLTLSELNLARLNKKLILFNAGLRYFQSENLSCSNLFDDRFFSEKKLKNSFPLNSKKDQKDLNVCLISAAKNYATTHFSVKNKSIFPSFHKSLNYELALEVIKNNNFTSILLSENLAPMAQLDFLNLIDTENRINSFISRLAPSFKTNAYDLFNEIYNPCMDYIANVLHLDIKKSKRSVF